MTQALNRTQALALLAVGLVSMLALALLVPDPSAAAVDWTDMTSGLKNEFETAVTTVLPIVGAIVAVFLAYKAIRRFVKA